MKIAAGCSSLALLVVGAAAAAQPSSVSTQGQAATLPSIHDLLLLSDKVEEASTKVHSLYEWVQLDRFEGVHNGTDVPTETECRLGYSVQGVELTRRLMKNGTAVSAQEIASTDREAERIIRNGQKRKGAPVATRLPIGSGALLERVGTFSNMHRITFAGRPSIMVNYEGDPHRKASSMEEKLGRAMTGMLIFDEAEGALASIDMHLAKSFGYLLLLRMKPGARFVATMTRTPEGVWVPQLISSAGQGRIFFNAVSMSMETRFSDYVYTGTHTSDIYVGKVLKQYPLHVQKAMTSLMQEQDSELTDQTDLESSIP